MCGRPTACTATTRPCRSWPGAELKTARLWTYVRDDRPFTGGAPPAALFFFSPDREKTHPNRHLAGWQGVLQADAYGGYNDLYRADRAPAPVVSALCWSHARRKFSELADIAGNVRKGRPAHEVSPVALEAVKRIDALFDVERGLGGLTAEARLEARQRLARPLVEDLHDWLLAERARMSKHAPVAKAINYMLEKDRRTDFTPFLDDGRICLTNNAAERSLRGAALGRKSWLFAGSERGGDRGLHVFPDRHGQDERHRSAGLAARCPRAHAELAHLAPAGPAPVDLAAALCATESSLMARVTHVYSIGHVAKMIGESLELIEVVSWNSDNIDHGEMIHVHDGSEEGSSPRSAG